jgi:hypothetical protein
LTGAYVSRKTACISNTKKVHLPFCQGLKVELLHREESLYFRIPELLRRRVGFVFLLRAAITVCFDPTADWAQSIRPPKGSLAKTTLAVDTAIS